ncbi:hypothetical protein Riv7116_6809 [Rivularia sp. PCC 7116]|uniref:hypothetical protein n=1 Tax=Rivularia sp. PCC 7116 TaxID=373994 RepID=UPI00029F3FE2|nr:hypothetical protein [Rivularia sp. PCC 7116]AFY59125.1 hypothetical protein Riv7116_6809 [Rivularia sp. PCC 7116]
MYTELLLLSQILSTDSFSINQSKYTQSETVVNLYSQHKSQKSQKNFNDMLEALGERETGFKSGDLGQYNFVNPQLYFLGKYQFAEILLIRLGYYRATSYFGNGAKKNYWRGTWTNKDGINSKAEFLNSPEVQEKAIREAFGVYWQDINYLINKRGKSIESYLSQVKTFNESGKPKTIKITLSGIIAAAHLKGPDKVVDLLVSGKVSQDPFGTSILAYLSEFGGYETTPKDFLLP